LANKNKNKSKIDKLAVRLLVLVAAHLHSCQSVENISQPHRRSNRKRRLCWRERDRARKLGKQSQHGEQKFCSLRQKAEMHSKSNMAAMVMSSSNKNNNWFWLPTTHKPPTFPHPSFSHPTPFLSKVAAKQKG